MASWRDKMRAAKFRAVEFYVESSDGSGGRRSVVHEYPQRDKPFVEDLGLKARGFTLDAYVIGDDYLNKRNALLAALESDEGPGELAHPYVGTRRVAVISYRYRESKDEGGMCRFQIEFVETDATPLQPTAVQNPAAKVATSVTIAKTAAASDFKTKYLPGALLTSLSDSLVSASQTINAQSNNFGMSAQAVAGLQQNLAMFAASAASNVSSPDAVLNAVSNLFDFITGSTLAAIQAIFGFNPGVRPPATTSNRVREQANFDAIQNLIKNRTVIKGVELAPSQPFASYQEAVAHRDALVDMLDSQADGAGDALYPALLQLRADLVKAVPGEDSDLPYLTTYTPVVTLPSLVIAHKLYGNLDREADLLARNKVNNPVFVGGGKALEILSDS